MRYAHRRRAPRGCVLAVVVCVVGQAAAVEGRAVAPGEFIDPQLNPLTGVSLADRPDLAGQVIADLVVPFTDGVALTGTIRTQVVREDLSGTLDFYYTITPAEDVYTVSGFNGFTTDVDWRIDLGTGARGVGRSADGGELSFSLPAGGPTFVKTNATRFDRRGEFEVFGHGAPGPATADVFAPAAIPLPPAVFAAPAAFALAALAGQRIRRKPGLRKCRDRDARVLP